jgi:phage shock protein PspC (stress-responsive transcriptional regulator)
MKLFRVTRTKSLVLSGFAGGMGLAVLMTGDPYGLVGVCAGMGMYFTTEPEPERFSATLEERECPSGGSLPEYEPRADEMPIRSPLSVGRVVPCGNPDSHDPHYSGDRYQHMTLCSGKGTDA